MKILACHRLDDILKEKIKSKLEKRHELIFAENLKEAERYLDIAEVLIGIRITGNIIRGCKNLRLVHSITAGVDRIDLDAIRERGIPLCNTRGAYSIAVAEHAIALMLVWELKLLRQIEKVRVREWDIVHHGELFGKTIGIIGYGDIGREIAKRAKALGMRVLAIKREPAKKDDFLDFLGTKSYLDLLLQESDYVVICLPLTKDTYHLIGEKELKKMKKNAVLVNVARGAIVDEKSLSKALENNWISGALLDVLEKEPPNPENPLLLMNNVLITPHTSGVTLEAFDRVASIIAENISRLERGDKLINEVDLTRGY